MEERHVNTVLLCEAMQLDLNTLQGPSCRQITTILRTVGIADHDRLAISTSNDMLSVHFSAEGVAQDLASVLKIVDRLKQWDNRQMKILVLRTSPIHSFAPLPKPQYGQQIAGLLCHANDMATQRLHAKPTGRTA